MKLTKRPLGALWPMMVGFFCIVECGILFSAGVAYIAQSMGYSQHIITLSDFLKIELYTLSVFILVTVVVLALVVRDNVIHWAFSASEGGGYMQKCIRSVFRKTRISALRKKNAEYREINRLFSKI